MGWYRRKGGEKWCRWVLRKDGSGGSLRGVSKGRFEGSFRWGHFEGSFRRVSKGHSEGFRRVISKGRFEGVLSKGHFEGLWGRVLSEGLGRRVVRCVTGGVGCKCITFCFDWAYPSRQLIECQ